MCKVSPCQLQRRGGQIDAGGVQSFARPINKLPSGAAAYFEHFPLGIFLRLPVYEAITMLVILFDKCSHLVKKLRAADFTRIAAPELGGVDILGPVVANLVDGFFFAAFPEKSSDRICHELPRGY